MKLLDRIKKRIDTFLFNSAVDSRDRAFVVFSVSEIGALIASLIVGIFLHEPASSTIAQLVIIVICISLLIMTLKTGRLKGARIVVAFILICFLQPLLFFTKGGIHGGATLSILLGSFYLVMVLEGRFRIIMCLADLCILVACWITAYLRPELVTEYNRESDYIFSFSKYIISWLVLTAIITFQTRIYQRQARISEESAKELKELNRAQNRFFSSMSHEIRTPINTVLGLNEIILRQEDASDEIRKDARNIQGAGRLLLALINDILDISKIEAGKMDIVPVNYNVSSLLSEVVNMIWLKAEEKGLKFNVDIDPNVPEMLFGDEVRIKQVLINLLNNAVKYTQEGSVSLHMECEFPETGEAFLKINISDTGMGIKPDALPHLFDTFQRVDEEKNRYIEGTGLGLSIVKQLVELMNGEITVDSVYGEGSVFAVTLKQGISSDKRIGDISVSNAGHLGTDSKFAHSFHAPSASILIVDDNEMNLQVESKLLDGTEMTVDMAISGAEALAKTLEKRYDVIFMDHLMPQMDGIECFNKIRTQNGGLNTDVPIVVLTANAGGENIDLYNNTGFDGYLVKPVSGRQLENMLIEHLPTEKVMISADSEMTGSVMSTSSGYSRKKPVVIATSTMCDLPKEVVRDLGISQIPYTVTTDDGVFYDSIDIDSEELVRYMGEELRFATSDPPTEDDFIEFFSSELQKTHHVIFITLSSGSSREYGRAANVAKSFDNVTVINSEFVSSGTGILVLVAARLAQQHLPVEKIVAELEEAKKYIRCSFVVRNTDVMARRKIISPFINSALNVLWLRPLLRVKNGSLGVGKMLFGNDLRCYEKYIRSACTPKAEPDLSFAFVTYAGMEEEELLWIRDKILERIHFENIIFQKASAGITSNCGGGTFGVLYMLKGDRNYNLGSFLSTEIIDSDIELFDVDEDADAILEDITAAAEDDGTPVIEPSGEMLDRQIKEPAWYENIPGIDSKAAIKNSGSEEAFLSVIRIYYDTFDIKSGEIQSFYDSEDWENYTIKVHALKSSSRLVGALQLGEAAAALENAGKDGDIDFIKNHHEDMMNAYRDIKDALTPELGSDEDRPEIPADMLSDAYAGLGEFADAMDYELSKMVLDSVNEYSLPKEDEERFDRLKKSLSAMNWEEIRDILKEV
ncbi:MAG: DegV family EDD domain-containing protein [Lachnospiraceae bacterium]|nr:DegV family EDD domain-containing protein [Lachnospiraceae bacterium]